MRIKKFAYFLLASYSLLTLLLPKKIYAQVKEWEQGVCVQHGDVATIQGLGCLIGNVLAVIITVIGLAAFVMFIYGSFRWMLAGSNSKNVETARNSFIYAVAGIVVALSSYIVLRLISDFTGIDVTKFIIPNS